jgi:hypothetical protein
MHLQERIDLLVELGSYMSSDQDGWLSVRQRASQENGWFIPEFIDLSVQNIFSQFLDENKLKTWVKQYDLSEERKDPKTIGLVMAGNIPLVGFHDFLSVFISGHAQTIKPSSRDHALIEHLVQRIWQQDKRTQELISFSELPKGSDAYIATGSNQSARYFEYYFKKYPHLIRRNRTSIAILLGDETPSELEKLADDVFLYFGLGCRNVTKLFVPKNYDFIPMLRAFEKFDWLGANHKYKNNYDYQLTLLLLNKRQYMTNGSVLLAEDSSPFSPISSLHYEFYADSVEVYSLAHNNQDIQCIIGKGQIPFGEAQNPGLSDYADGVDTMDFLVKL